MGVSEERVDYEINLKVAQALIELDKLNASAASFPEVVANVNAAMKKMEVETGLSLGAIEAKFKTVGAAGDAFRAKLLSKYPGINTDFLSPLENAGQPFGEVGAQAGYKATDAARAEEAALTKLQVKDEAAIAAEKNSQIAAEKQLVIEKEKNLALSNAERVAIEQAGAKLSNNLLSKQRVADQAVLEKQNAEGLKLNATQEKLLEKESKRLALLNQEQVALEKQGASLNNQLGLYGQVAKTSSEMMASLRAFSGTKQGQGILTNFFGDYKQASGVTQQIGAIKTAVTDLSRATGASFSQSGQIIKEQFSQIPGVVNQTNQAVRQLGGQFEDTSGKASKMASHLKSLLTTFLAFAAVSAIIKVFGEATKAARELEVSLFRLSNAERILSESGSDVSMEGFKDGIAEIKKLFPIFSEEDITQLVAQLSIATKDFGFSQKQLIELAKNAAVFNIRSTEEESVSQTGAKLATSLSVKGKGIGSLNVSFSKTTMEAKALELGIIKVGDTLTGLSDKDMALIKIAVISDNANKEMEKMGDYLDTNDAKIRTNAASWHDLLTNAGALLNSLVPILTPFIQLLDAAVNGTKLLFFLFGAGVEAIGLKLKDLATGGKKSFQEIFDSAAKNNFNLLFPVMPKGVFGAEIAPDSAMMTIWNKYHEVVETATGDVEDFQDGTDSIDTTKAQEELKDLLKDLENLKDKMSEKEADYQLDLGRFDDDALRDQQRAIEDYNLNVEQAIRDANLAKHDSNAKYHQKELEEERKFEEDMRKLQEDFLYNLEDALRERDARQVLRLIDKYNMDKTALENENALRKKASAEQHASEEADRKAQLDEKLRVMAEEQALKMQRMEEDSALKRARMEEDHAIEMQRLEEQLTERIQQAADKMAEEYGVNAEGAKAIFDLLSEYYGTDGALAQLTEQGYNAMLQNASGFLTALAGIIGQTQALMSSMSSHPLQPTYPGAGEAPPATPPPSGPFSGYAKGGQFVATRPQKIVVGEGGQPELVQITPMSNIAKGINGKGGISGVNGFDGSSGQTQISVSVDLSPDLEARVVNKAMDGTANVISKIRRGKQ